MKTSKAERIFASHGFTKTSGADGDKYVYEKWGYKVTIYPMQTEIKSFGRTTVIENHIIRAVAEQIKEIFEKED